MVRLLKKYVEVYHYSPYPCQEILLKFANVFSKYLK